MPRTSPVHYIAPSAISITPNANNSYNDLSVYIANGAKIKVWSGRAGIGMVDSTYQEWTLKGRNRRLAESGKPYTIYARLSKSDNSNAYLVFAPMEMRGSKWTDKYPCVTTDGESRDYYGTIDPDNWYVRIGEVSLPENNLRTVDLDTGILGTDEYNKEWSLDPDSLPLRVEIRSEGMDAGVPYLRWGGSIILSPVLIKGFDETATTSVDRWMITRNTGNTNTDNQWNASKANGFTDSIELKHEAGSSGTDDFSASVSATFYISACVADESEITGFSTIATGTITIIAETKEKFEIELSSGTVSYDDTSGRYIPENNINIFIRSIAQDGSVFYINEAWFRTAGLALFYDPVDSEDSSDDTPLVFSGATTGKAVLPITAFTSRKSLNVHLVVNNTNVELAIVTVNFIPATRDIHYYTTSETKDLNEGGVGMGAELVYWNPDQSFFSNEESAYFFNEFRPYMWRKTLQYPILIDGTIDDIGDHYEDAILPDGVEETEAPHVIGVYGETGVNYICQTEKDYIAIDTATDKGEFGGSIRFYTDNGGVRNAFPCYCRVYKRTGDTRTLLFNGANLAIFSMPYREIESSVDVVEVFAASSINASNPDEMVDTYLIKKEIPLIKAAKGDKGDPGDAGYAGALTRVFQDELIYGFTYYSETSDVVIGTSVANYHYQDYIAVPCDGYQSGYIVFKCVDNNGYTHPTTAQHPAGDKFKISETYKTAIDIIGFMMNLNGGLSWEEVNVNAASAFFTNLIAQNAYIRMLTGSNFVITDNLGHVLAGMGNMTDSQGNQYYIWAGGANADNATFKVFADGTIDAMRGSFSGFLTSKETLVTALNVDDYVSENVCPCISPEDGGTGADPQDRNVGYIFDMDKIGSTLSFFQTGRFTAKYSGTQTYQMPQGYGDIEYQNIHIPLPYDHHNEGSYTRETYLARYGGFAGGNVVDGLGLYRYFKVNISSNKISTTAAKQLTSVPSASATSDEFYLYPFQYTAEIGAKARQLVGNKITIRLYGEIYSGLTFSGIYFEKTLTVENEWANSYIQNEATLHDVFTFEDIKKIIYGNTGSHYSSANCIVLECKQIAHYASANPSATDEPDYYFIGWIPTISFLGYYDRYTIGLPDITT